MKITIQPPLFLNETGRRANNEDSIFTTATEAAVSSPPVFLVCDGVGGAEKGEIASSIVAEGFGAFFQKTVADTTNIGQALALVQTQLDLYLETNPDAIGMGTTLTFLQLHEQGATIAHIGDSRVYHLRNGEILFQTEDHSLVNDMRKQGVPVDESTKSNVITRAVQGHSVRKVAADVHTITDIQAGDVFFLCSDGIWEALSNKDLQDLSHTPLTNSEKIAFIKNLCTDKSRDNYSAYWIQIDKVEGENAPSQPTLTPSFDDKDMKYPVRNIAVEDTNKPRKNAWLIPLLFLIVLAIALLFIWQFTLLNNE